MAIRIRSAVVLLALLPSGCTKPAVPSAAEGAAWDASVADPVTEETDALRLIERIRGTEPTGDELCTWERIATSGELSETRRRRAFIELFDRSFRPGMTLAEFGESIGAERWLEAGFVDARGGEWMPIDMVSGETVFRVLPRGWTDTTFAIYVRFDGSLADAEIYNDLIGARIAPESPKLTAMVIQVKDPDEQRIIRPALRSPLPEMVTVNYREIPNRVTIIGKLGVPLNELMTIRGRWVETPTDKFFNRHFQVEWLNGNRLGTLVKFRTVEPAIGAEPNPVNPGKEVDFRGVEMGGFTGFPRTVIDEWEKQNNLPMLGVFPGPRDVIWNEVLLHRPQDHSDSA